jgi:hypothetical protein
VSSYCDRAVAHSLPPGRGGDEYTPHDLRHFYASLLIRFGESVKTVQRRLGHSSAKTTLDIYGHLWGDSDETTRSAVSAEGRPSDAAFNAEGRPNLKGHDLRRPRRSSCAGE